MSTPGRGENSSTFIRKMIILEENSMSASSRRVWGQRGSGERRVPRVVMGQSGERGIMSHSSSLPIITSNVLCTLNCLRG